MRRPSDLAHRAPFEGEAGQRPILRPVSPAEPGPQPPRPAPAEIVGGDPALAAALERCAARDAAGLAELRAWQGGRLRETLLRTLGDPVLADRALEAALTDLWDNAGVYQTLGRGPVEDRVFAILRRHAHALLREQGSPPPAPRPQAPPPPSPLPPAAAAPPAPAPLPDVPPPEPAQPLRPAAPPRLADPAPADPEAPLAPTLATRLAEAPSPQPMRRLRRLEAAASPFDEPYAEPMPERRARRGWGRWLLLLLAWVVAGGIGFGLAYVAFQLSAGHDAATLWQPRAGAPPSIGTPAQPEATPAQPGPTPKPAPPKPSASSLGAPLAAPEPPAVALRPLELADEPLTLPEPRPVPDQALAITPAQPAPVPQPRPVVEATLPPQARIFLHFTAGDEGSATRAQALRDALQRRGAGFVQLVPVRFAIGTPSVRYFYPEDRLTAQRLLQTARGGLAGDGKPAPTEPTDFTRFRPSPSPGTIEVWLPGGG